MKDQQPAADAGNLVHLDGQLAEWRKHERDAATMMVCILLRSWDTIRQEAQRRLVSGFPVYGSTGWDYSQDRLRQEAIEELADCLNYVVMYLAQEDEG